MTISPDDEKAAEQPSPPTTSAGGGEMRDHKLTAWEVGNDLCACSDYLGEKEEDAHNAGFTEHAELLRDLRIRIANFFNKNHREHGFGLGPTERRKPRPSQGGDDGKA